MGKREENELLKTIVEMQKKEIRRLEEGKETQKTVHFNTIGETSWGKADTSTIEKLLAEHYAEKISIFDYWGIGDEREIQLGGEIRQTIQMVLTDKEFYLSLDGSRPLAFTVDQKNCLKDIRRPMNKENSNEGGWADCEMREWVNSVYGQAFPKEYKEIFKPFILQDSVCDMFALRSEIEVFGEKICGSEENGRQIEYYKKTRNRIKLNGDDFSESRWWWERSPNCNGSDGFCYVSNGGGANYGNAGYAGGIAPFGCL